MHRSLMQHPVSVRSRRLLAPWAFLPTILLLSACGDAEPEGGPVTAYEGARVITGTGDQPIEDAVILVQEGSFLAVGPRAEVEVPGSATRVDLTGRTVMPALVNAHMHTPATDRQALVSFLEHNAYWGVGAVASMGTDSTTISLQVRDEGVPGAARLLTAGRGITAPEPGRTEVPYWVTTEEEGRAAVQELAAKPVDLVKIWVEDRSGQYEKLSPSVYVAVIDEAHTHGLRVAAHIFALEDAKNLLRARVDAFAHSIRDQEVDDEFITLFQSFPLTTLIPNLPDPGVERDMSWVGETVSDDRASEIQAAATDRPDQQAAYEIQANNLVRLQEVGMSIAFGTDGGNPWSAHAELADMVRAGLSPADVIVAATRGSAALLGLNDTGSIEEGNAADFVVLDANPLDDITNTRRISAVFLRGQAVDRAGIAARLKSAQPAGM